MDEQLTHEREQLRDGLIQPQKSTAVQLLLEICLPEYADVRDFPWNSPLSWQVLIKYMFLVELCWALSDLRQVTCIVCSYLHQKFIADPALVKLVHFQVTNKPLQKQFAVLLIKTVRLCVCLWLLGLSLLPRWSVRWGNSLHAHLPRFHTWTDCTAQPSTTG